MSRPAWVRDTALFLSSQTLSLFGSSLVQYAILWHITLVTQSGVMMTLYIVFGFTPTFFLSPFAGVWADRYDRKKLIVLSDLMIALATLVLAILFLVGYEHIWLLFVAAAVRAVGGAVQMPAVGAFLPQIVPEAQLTRVNGINGSIQSAIMLASPMASGALLTVTGIEAVFFIDVATAISAALILLLAVRVPSHRAGGEKITTTYFSDMKDGIRYIRGHAYILRYFVFCAVFFVLIAPSAFLTPLQVARSFGSDVWRLTAIEIAFSVGMMAGGGVIAAWGGFRNRVRTMALATVVIGIFTAALGVISWFPGYLAVMVFIGLTIPLFNTPATVLLQERVDGLYLGRVFGVLSMISSTMMPLGMLAFGPLADLVAIEWLLIGTGLLLGLQGILLRRDGPLLQAGEPAGAKPAGGEVAEEGARTDELKKEKEAGE